MRALVRERAPDVAPRPGQDLLPLPRRRQLGRPGTQAGRIAQGELYLGRGSRAHGLAPSQWGNPYRLSQVLRRRAVADFKKLLYGTPSLLDALVELQGAVLVCH